MASNSSSTPRATAEPLLVPQGDRLGKSPLRLAKAVVVVGCEEHCHLHLRSSTISRHHAIIIQDKAGVYVRDLGSRTKVVVNGEPQREAALEDGDEIHFGRFSFKFSTANHRPPSENGLAPAQVIVNGSARPEPLSAKTLLIGRGDGCDLAVDSETVSSRHAIIFTVGGKRYIRDLDSRTGTFVNGKEVHQQEIKFGDELRVGTTMISLADLKGAPAKAAQPVVAAAIAKLPAVAKPAPLAEPVAVEETPEPLDFDLGPTSQVEQPAEPLPLEETPEEVVHEEPTIQATVPPLPIEPSIDVSGRPRAAEPKPIAVEETPESLELDLGSAHEVEKPTEPLALEEAPQEEGAHEESIVQATVPPLPVEPKIDVSSRARATEPKPIPAEGTPEPLDFDLDSAPEVERSAEPASDVSSKPPVAEPIPLEAAEPEINLSMDSVAAEPREPARPTGHFNAAAAFVDHPEEPEPAKQTPLAHEPEPTETTDDGPLELSLDDFSFDTGSEAKAEAEPAAPEIVPPAPVDLSPEPDPEAPEPIETPNIDSAEPVTTTAEPPIDLSAESISFDAESDLAKEIDIAPPPAAPTNLTQEPVTVEPPAPAVEPIAEEPQPVEEIPAEAAQAEDLPEFTVAPEPDVALNLLEPTLAEFEHPTEPIVIEPVQAEIEFPTAPSLSGAETSQQSIEPEQEQLEPTPVEVVEDLTPEPPAAAKIETPLQPATLAAADLAEPELVEPAHDVAPAVIAPVVEYSEPPIDAPTPTLDLSDAPSIAEPETEPTLRITEPKDDPIFPPVSELPTSEPFEVPVLDLPDLRIGQPPEPVAAPDLSDTPPSVAEPEPEPTLSITEPKEEPIFPAVSELPTSEPFDVPILDLPDLKIGQAPEPEPVPDLSDVPAIEPAELKAERAAVDEIVEPEPVAEVQPPVAPPAEISEPLAEAPKRRGRPPRAAPEPKPPKAKKPSRARVKRTPPVPEAESEQPAVPAPDQSPADVPQESIAEMPIDIAPPPMAEPALDQLAADIPPTEPEAVTVAPIPDAPDQEPPSFSAVVQSPMPPVETTAPVEPTPPIDFAPPVEISPPVDIAAGEIAPPAEISPTIDIAPPVELSPLEPPLLDESAPLPESTDSSTDPWAIPPVEEDTSPPFVPEEPVTTVSIAPAPELHAPEPESIAPAPELVATSPELAEPTPEPYIPAAEPVASTFEPPAPQTMPQAPEQPALPPVQMSSLGGMGTVNLDHFLGGMPVTTASPINESPGFMIGGGVPINLPPIPPAPDWFGKVRFDFDSEPRPAPPPKPPAPRQPAPPPSALIEPPAPVEEESIAEETLTLDAPDVAEAPAVDEAPAISEPPPPVVPPMPKPAAPAPKLTVAPAPAKPKIKPPPPSFTTRAGKRIPFSTEAQEISESEVPPAPAIPTDPTAASMPFDGLAMPGFHEADVFSNFDSSSLQTNDAVFGGARMTKPGDFPIPESPEAAERLNENDQLDRDFADDDFWNRTDEEDDRAAKNAPPPAARMTPPPPLPPKPPMPSARKPEPKLKLEPKPAAPSPKPPVEPEIEAKPQPVPEPQFEPEEPVAPELEPVEEISSPAQESLLAQESPAVPEPGIAEEPIPELESQTEPEPPVDPELQLEPEREPEPEPVADSEFQPAKIARPPEPLPADITQEPAQTDDMTYGERTQLAEAEIASPPPRKRRRFRIPFLMPAIWIAMIGGLLYVWFLLPVASQVVGTLSFVNFQWTPGTQDAIEMEATQRRLLQDQVRPLSNDILKANAPGMSAGFLDAADLYNRAISSIDFSGSDQTNPPRTYLSLKYNGADKDGDRIRMLALLQALRQANAPLLDDNRRLHSAAEKAQRAVDDAQQKLEDIKNNLTQEQAIIDAQPTIDDLARLTSAKADAQRAKLDAEDSLSRDEAEVSRLQNATPNVASGTTQPDLNDPQVNQMQQQLADLSAELDSARSDQVTAAVLARRQLEDAAKDFNQQVSAANQTLDSSSQLRQFVDSAMDTESKARDLINMLIIDGEDLEEQLEDTRRQMDDMIETRQAAIWAADGQLTELRDKLQSAQHRYNANVGQGISDPRILDPIQRDIDTIGGQIKDRQSQLGVDPSEIKVQESINHVIVSLRNKLTKEKQQIDAALDPLERQLSDLTPTVSALPQAEQDLARLLRERLEALNNARTKYAKTVGDEDVSPSTKVSGLQTQITDLKSRITARKTELSNAITSARDTQRQTALSAAQADVTKDQTNLNTATKTFDTASAAYDDARARHATAMTAQQKQIMLLDDKRAASTDLENAKRDLDEKQSAAIHAFDIAAVSEDDVHPSTIQDPRIMYMVFIGCGGLIAIAVLGFLSHSARRAEAQVATPFDDGDSLSLDLPDSPSHEPY